MTTVSNRRWKYLDFMFPKHITVFPVDASSLLLPPPTTLFPLVSWWISIVVRCTVSHHLRV